MCAAMLGKASAVKTTALGTAFLAGGMGMFWTAGGVACALLRNSLVLEFALAMLVYIITRRTRHLASR